MAVLRYTFSRNPENSREANIYHHLRSNQESLARKSASIHRRNSDSLPQKRTRPITGHALRMAHCARCVAEALQITNRFRPNQDHVREQKPVARGVQTFF